MNLPDRIRHRIIGAMIRGEITFPEAMRLQAIKGSVELIMAAQRAGINTEKRGN